MKKYVLSGLIAIGCVVSIHNSVYADFQYDCALIAQGPEIAFEKVYKPQGYALTSLVDESVIKLSLQHLANYCCAKNFNDIKTSSPQACKSSENNIGGVESPYIFDQLVDLSFRKLDAYKDNTLMYGMPADIKGAAWQKLLSDFEDPSKNMIPEKVIEGFAAYRPNQELVSTQTIGNKCGVTNADALSLKGRYEAACNISRCISSDVTTVFSNSETSAKILQSSNPCMEDANGNTEKGLVQQRFLAEASYARQLLARVGIRTITNLVQQYTQNYFVGNRRQSLYEQFTTFDQYISFVNRKVQEGTPVCSAK